MFFYSETYIDSLKRIASDIRIPDSRILITGASGLIGSCIIDSLIIANRFYNRHFIIYAMGRDKNKLVNRFGEINDLEFIIQDVINPINVNRLDYIIHAASNADPKSYALYPVETLCTNFLGTRNVLEYSKYNKTRVLLTSSFEVYGRIETDYYIEDKFGVIDLNLIRSCYPESKRAAEMLMKSYNDEYSVDCVIARLSSVYGPTMLQNDSKAHAQFLRNAIEGKDIILKSEGTQRRTYCYVMDAISGIFSVLEKGLSGEAYNVANENSVASIAEVAETIAKLTGSNVVFDLPDKIESKGFSQPQNCVLDTKKIKSIGWSGKYNLIDGLAETISILMTQKD